MSRNAPTPGLEDALLKEASAVLALLVGEAAAHLRNPGPAGFPECGAVEAASAEYVESQDEVKLFFNEKTEPGGGMQAMGKTIRFPEKDI